MSKTRRRRFDKLWTNVARRSGPPCGPDRQPTLGNDPPNNRYRLDWVALVGRSARARYRFFSVPEQSQAGVLNSEKLLSSNIVVL